jgi:hypothetical protein
LPDTGKFRKKSSNIAVEKNYLRRKIGAELWRKYRKGSGIRFKKNKINIGLMAAQQTEHKAYKNILVWRIKLQLL